MQPDKHNENMSIVNPQGLMPRGMDDFAEVVTQRRCFVDKSLLIQELLFSCGDKIALITRPRRFGKTFNQSMLQYFFEVPAAQTHTKTLFDGLLVAKDTATMAHQGKYPIISLTLKSTKLPTWEEAYSKLCDLMHEEIQRHPEAFQWRVGEFERMHAQQWQRILERTEATQNDWSVSLQLLCKLLAIHHNKDNPNPLTWTMPIVLIDEYDAPIHAAYTHSMKRGETLKDDESYYGRMVNFIRSLLGNALKGNRYLYKAVLTGIFRVAKEDIFSGLNNLGVYRVSDWKFASFFGFTETEMQALFEQRSLQKQMEPARQWYNGYRFGRDTLYNPWSVISFVSNLPQPPQPYWVNTSDNAVVHTLLRRADAEMKNELLQLLSGASKHVVRSILDDAPLRMLTGSARELWSLLLAAGYATCDTVFHPQDGGAPQAHLRLPNTEVKRLYRDLIEGWFAQEPCQRQTTSMVKALLAGNGELFTQRLQAFVLSSMSYFSTGGEDPERVYQAFVLGLLVQLEQDYRLRSEREAGEGRADVLLIPKQANKPGIILEFKLAESVWGKEDQAVVRQGLQQTAQAALQQIKDKNYAAEFAQQNCRFVLAVGIAFAGKRLATAHQRV